MSVFEPRTFSTDWEVIIIDRLDRMVDTQKCDAFAGVLGAEFDLPIQMDWNTIEFGLGINTSFQQFWDRVEKVTDRTSEVIREYDLDLFPSGGHPIEGMCNASHVHVGCIHDETQGIYLENQIMKYVPAFAALAANSPFYRRCRNEYKSYRVRNLAHGCSRPGFVRDPHLSQTNWGSDAAPKLYGVPTMEVRILDCASSRRLMAEMGVFVAAFLHHQGEKVSRKQPGKKEYRNGLTNRWLAARDGMQATFLWEDGTRAIVEILDEMLDQCKDALARLGAKRSDLTIMNKMIEKRICQADFAIDLGRRYEDVYLLTSAYSKMLRQWDAFEEYLGNAKKLEPIPAPDEKEIMEAHLAGVGEDTHFYNLRGVMHYPAPVADEIIERMIREGLIEREVTSTRGALLHRK